MHGRILSSGNADNNNNQNNLLLLLLVVVYWRINHQKSSNLDSFIDLFCRGSGGVDIVLTGGWRPRLFVLFTINLYVQGPTSNNIIEVKFLSIT